MFCYGGGRKRHAVAQLVVAAELGRSPAHNNMEKLIQQLQWSLQALAQEAHVQAGLYPPSVVVPDELALEFNHCLVAATENHKEEFTPDQLRALESVDAYLEQMSGSDKADHWTTEALQSDVMWMEVRALAKQALVELEWSNNVPPTDPMERRSFYVPGE